MENFKLDLTQLTPVAEADRIKGNWYVVADKLNEYGGISQWHSGRNRISPNDGDEGIKFDLWFAIPPNLPGFPKAELPDEFEIVSTDWELINIPYGTRYRKRKPILMPITIPSGTKSEQIEAVRKILAELEAK